MSDNPFALSNIEQGGGAAAPANDNPFALSNIEHDQQADLRVELQRAVRTNPDQAARAAHLAKKYPVPQDVLARNLQDVEFQAAVDAADERLRTSPTLAKAMRDGKSWLAPQAHDDVEPLAQVEQFFRDTGGSVKAGVFNASKGAAGVFRAGFELVAPALDILEPVTAVGGNPLRRLAEGFALQAEAAGASAKAVTPQTSNVVSAGFQSGIQSLTQNLLTLPLAFAPGGQAAALGGMTAFTGGQSYQDAREKGLPMTQALPFAASQAAIEYATEKLPLARLVGDVKAGTPFFQMLARQVAAEVPGEQVATILQDLNDWAVLNPEKPFSSYLEERPSAAAQTLVATIVGAGGNVAVVKGIETVVNRAVNGSRQIQEAERTSAGLQTALQAAAASKLRERNPETFKQLVQTMAEESGGDMSSVFIDAQTLAQAGVNVAEMFPSAAEQMDAALATNGSVEVSIAEVLTAVPGTPLEQVFLQNARGTADGLSLAEAQQAFEQADQWKVEADRVMAEAQDQAAWQADTDAVKTTILDQLNTAGRFTPDVNEAYATFVGQFFSVMAARQGITPQEMYARYPLRVTAQQPGPGGQLEQGNTYPLAPRDQWYGEGTFKENGGRLVYVTPDEYIAAVRPLTLDDESRENIDILKGHIQDGKTLDPLLIRADGKEDGRHRAYAAKELGIQRVPVIAYGDQFAGAQEVESDAFNQTPATTTYTADTITVDGKERPATNSNGQRIAATEQGLVNFWRWFGDSKVVDDQGKPLVVYHGRGDDFAEFNTSGGKGKTFDTGAFFTANPAVANSYATGEAKNVVPVYLRIAAPVEIDAKGKNWSRLGKAVKVKTPTVERTSTTAQEDENLMAELEGRPPVTLKPEKVKGKSTTLDKLFPEEFQYGDETLSTDDLARWARKQGFEGVRFSDVIDRGPSGHFATAEAQTPSDNFVAFDPTQIKSAIGNDGTFSGQDANILRQDQQRDLVVTHNLTADNLLHAAKMGGIPVPSLAVTKKDNPLTGFGEITLIGPPELADPKGYAGTKVFGADIYSPRYPSVTFEFTPKARKQGEAMLKEGMAATGQTYMDWSEVERDGARELERQPAVMWQFLKSKGVEPTVVRTEPKPLPAQLQPFKDDTRHAHELAADPAFVEAVWAVQLEILTRAYGNAADAAADIAQQKENAAQRGRSQLVNSYAQSVVQYQRDARQSGQIDKDATRHALGNQVREADLDVELRDYAAAIVTELNPNERIFQGFTNSGNRKYVPHTLENVVKILKKELRGGENFNYGVGSLRAKFTPQFKSVADIRKNKDRLISAADFDKIKDDINNEFLNMADAMNIQSETLSAIMEDAAKLGVQRAAAQYDVDVGGGRDVQIAEFMARLRNLPTAYFEAKVLREVDLAEFAGAVVPEGVNPEVLKALADRGVKDIRTYKKGDEADRAAKIGDFNNLFFQQANGTYTPSQLLITLNETANLSTFLHESGHFFLEVMADLASQPNVPADVQADMAALLKWFGIKGNEQVGGADSGAPLAQATLPTFGDVKSLDAWLATNTRNEPEQMDRAGGPGDQGVGTITLDAGQTAVTYDGGMTGRDRVERSTADVSLLFRLDDGRLVYWDSPSGKVQQVQPNDPRISFKPGKENAPARNADPVPTEIAVTVDGEEYTLLFPDSPARMDDAAFNDELYSSGYDDNVQQAFRDARTNSLQPLHQDGNLPTDNTQPAGRTPLDVWRAMTLDQKRQYHERFAESFEQYLMEGKAPSTELQPLFRKFRSWLVNVYKSIKAFIASRVPVTAGEDSLEQRAPGTWFHGTTSDVRKFNRVEGGNMWGPGYYLTDNPDTASGYALGTVGNRIAPAGNAGPNIMPVRVADGDLFEMAAPLTPATLKKVEKALGQKLKDYTWQGMKNRDLRQVLIEQFTDQKGANALLQKAGFKGLVETSAIAGPGRTLMVFDAKDITSDITGETLAQGAAPTGPAIQLNDDIRRVFDRMLATDEQIRQAEEAAGMLPDFDATNEATEKLQARSLRDMKWAVGARSRALKALQKQAKELRKGVEAEVRAEVDAMPEFAAQRDLDKLRKENKRQPNEVEMAVVAEAHGFATTEAMLKAITDVGKKADVIEGMTDQRMLERHGDLIDQRAIEDAATEAVHNAVRARVLATELKAQADALNPRQDTGRTASNGRAITVNALTEAAKQFAQNVVARRRVTDLRKAAAQHRVAEAKAGKRWQEATAAGNTQEAVAAKRDQLLNNYTVKALTEAQAEAKKILEFFRKVTKDGNEKLVERGRDPDVVNAMRAILAAYDVAPRLEKAANDYMEIVARNDPAMFAALQPSVQGALQNAKPIGGMTVEELRGLNAEMQSMWHLAKRSRQMEIDGNLLDRETLEDELVARMVEIGIPDTVPGERSAITNRQELGIKLQFAKSILSRVEQWAERLDGKFGGPFLRYIFQPVKAAADRYRSERAVYRQKFTTLVDGIRDQMPAGPIAAPELGYTFGTARDSGMAEVMHAILHTGNDSNKRKLLLGRNWATENADGTLDTSRWDAFVQRLIDEGKLTQAHYDFAQGVWDLLEEMKPAAQRAHREVFGRYFAEVTANGFTTPFGTYRGGYVPAQTDSRIVDDAKLRELAEGENESMAYAFPAAPSGFTKARVEYNKPLLLDLRALAQHMDKVLLFTHMQPAITDARRLLMSKRVSYALNRVDPGAYEGMLIPWLNRSAKQIVETPIMGDRKLSRFLAAARARAGMALMFANISNTVQQLTGFSSAAVKVKPSLMMSALAQFVAHPKQVKQEVAQASEFMRDRMLNEVSAMNNVVEEILVNPSLYERSQAWTQRHAYFMQAAVDNTMAPIIWTAAYNQAIGEKMDAKDAVRFADGVIRQTQGSTLPEDVSRFETGPATARLFTQFIGYFNMMANTNATAVSQIVGEMGLRKGAGKLLYVALVGLLVPIWVAESIALAFKGGPDDEDMDGYLDDWLAAVFGLGTFKGIVAQVPLVGQGAQLVVNRFNTNPADDKFSLSPAVSLIESTVSAPNSVYKAIVDDGNAQKAVRDVAAAATMLTGLPFYAAARPIGYAAGVAQGKIDPTSEGDAVRGAITGTASKESKSP